MATIPPETMTKREIRAYLTRVAKAFKKDSSAAEKMLAKTPVAERRAILDRALADWKEKPRDELFPGLVELFQSIENNEQRAQRLMSPDQRKALVDDTNAFLRSLPSRLIGATQVQNYKSPSGGTSWATRRKRKK